MKITDDYSSISYNVDGDVKDSTIETDGFVSILDNSVNFDTLLSDITEGEYEKVEAFQSILESSIEIFTAKVPKGEILVKLVEYGSRSETDNNIVDINIAIDLDDYIHHQQYEYNNGEEFEDYYPLLVFPKGTKFNDSPTYQGILDEINISKRVSKIEKVLEDGDI